MFLEEAEAKFLFESRNGTIKETGATLYSDIKSLTASGINSLRSQPIRKSKIYVYLRGLLCKIYAKYVRCLFTDLG